MSRSPTAGLRAGANGIEATAAADANSLEKILSAHGASMQPLFGEPEGRLAARAPDLDGRPEPGSPRALMRYYHVEAPETELDETRTASCRQITRSRPPT